MAKPILYVGNRNYSSWSLRPAMMLAMAGIDHEQKLIRLGEPGFGRAIRRISGAGQVPVLVHNKLTVWDTLAIMEYLAETWPNRTIWPRNRAARAMARSLCAEMHAGFRALRSALPMNLRRPVKAIALSPAVKADIARLETIWKMARAAHGKGGPFLFGRFSAADAYFTPVVTRLETYDVKVARTTRDYMNAVMATPAFHDWKAMALKEPWVLPEDEVD